MNGGGGGGGGDNRFKNDGMEVKGEKKSKFLIKEISRSNNSK